MNNNKTKTKPRENKTIKEYRKINYHYKQCKQVN